MSTLRVNNMTNVGGTGPTYSTGHTIQTISTTINASASTSSTSFVDIPDLHVDITPRSSTSKFFIFVSGQSGQSNNSQATGLSLVRNGTAIYNGSGGSNNISSIIYTANTFIQATFCLTHLDTPSTTSAIRYKLQFRADSSGIAYVGRRGNDTAFAVPTTITVQEIAQ